jgi:hypothetical protein
MTICPPEQSTVTRRSPARMGTLATAVPARLGVTEASVVKPGSAPGSALIVGAVRVGNGTASLGDEVTTGAGPGAGVHPVTLTTRTTAYIVLGILAMNARNA